MKNFLAEWKKPMPSIFKSHNNPFFVVQEAINNAMENFYNSFDNCTAENWERFSITPAVDIVDTKDNIKFEIEMPGMGIEDIKVSVENNILTITGEKSTSHQDKGKNYKSREIAYGYYQRNIPLASTGLDLNKITASFKKGMLWITIPKIVGSTESRKEITIQSTEK